MFWGEQKMFSAFYAYLLYMRVPVLMWVCQTICWYNNGGELYVEYFSCLINTYYNKYYNIVNKINILKGKRWFAASASPLLCPLYVDLSSIVKVVVTSIKHQIFDERHNAKRKNRLFLSTWSRESLGRPRNSGRERIDHIYVIALLPIWSGRWIGRNLFLFLFWYFFLDGGTAKFHYHR